MNKILCASVLLLALVIVNIEVKKDEDNLVFLKKNREITFFQIKSSNKNFKFSFKNPRWIDEDKIEYLVDNDKINKFLESIFSLRYVEAAKESPEIMEESFEGNKKLEISGLSSETLEFGGLITFLEGRYLKKGNDYYLIKEKDFQKLDLSNIYKELNIKSYIDIQVKDIKLLKVKTLSNKLVIIKTGDSWKVNMKEGDSPFIRSFFKNILSLKLFSPQSERISCKSNPASKSVASFFIEDEFMKVSIDFKNPIDSDSNFLCVKFSNLDSYYLVKTESFYNLKIKEEHLSSL